MWWRWRKVRKANIPDELRHRFEVFGEHVLAHALGAGDLSFKGDELTKLLRENRDEMLEWVGEKFDEEARREDRLETVECAILIFVVFGVVVDCMIFARELGWLHSINPS